MCCACWRLIDGWRLGGWEDGKVMEDAYLVFTRRAGNARADVKSASSDSYPAAVSKSWLLVLDNSQIP